MKRHLLLSAGLFTLLMYFVSCQKESSFEVGQLANGFLQDSLGDCYPKNVNGSFAVGQSASSGSITVTVNVIQEGAYTIVTDTVNGFYFRGTGVFNATGDQTAQLQGHGTPTAEGISNFAVFYNATYCAIAVPVAPGGTPIVSDDYLPLAQNNWWSYDDGQGSDTTKTVVSGTSTLGGSSYSRLISHDDFGPYDTSYYRKDGSGLYFTYTPTDQFAGFGLTFTDPGLHVLFLKNTLTTGEVFNSDHQGTYLGIPCTLRFRNTVVNNNLTMTVNGKSFSNVYHLKVMLMLNIGSGFQALPVPELDFYYAKGVGLIKSAGFGEEHIRNWQIF